MAHFLHKWIFAYLDTRILRRYCSELDMLEEYRREYANFNHHFMREYYLFLSGQKTELELTRIYERYSDLFTEDSIIRLKRLLDESSPDFELPRASINQLLVFATDHYLESAVKILTEEVSRF